MAPWKEEAGGDAMTETGWAIVSLSIGGAFVIAVGVRAAIDWRRRRRRARKRGLRIEDWIARGRRW